MASLSAGCSLVATRPVQEMSDTSSAIRAAREVEADTKAPELYRQSNEWFFRARREYKFKNFKLAKEYAGKARHFAEQAEFEAIRNRGDSVERVSDPQATQAPPPEKPAPRPGSDAGYATPEGIPAEALEQQQRLQQLQQPQPPSGAPPAAGSAPGAPVTITPPAP